VVKILRSNPFQFALCFIILLDAVIVITQILIDINSVKGMCRPAEVLGCCIAVSERDSLCKVGKYLVKYGRNSHTHAHSK